MKIRTMKSKSAVLLMSELGASATPISFGELYTSLQQGVVDGAENNAITYYKSRHYEICKNFTVDEHNSIPGIIIFSQFIWQKLTQQQQAWVKEAMAESVAFQRKNWIKDTEDTYRILREAGINIIYPEKKLFMDKVENYKRSFDNTPVGDLLKRIEAK
jgi:TRAP-type C4-dicarboxylate transport system substrate-binding protein